jgi:hypothetical protein
MDWKTIAVHASVITIAVAVSIISFALLIPLESVQAASAVTIITACAYSISFAAWLLVLGWYSRPERQINELVWLNNNLLFLVILPTVIGATAMNVSAVQNTRNLIAGGLT